MAVVGLLLGDFIQKGAGPYAIGALLVTGAVVLVFGTLTLLLQDAPLIDAIVDMFARKSPDVFERQIRALLQRPDATEVLRAIRVPTLVLCGRQDSWAPVPQHEAMHALVPGAVFEVIEDAGHMAPMERPQAVAAALLRWLETP